MDDAASRPASAGHHQAQVRIPAARTFGISGVFDKRRGAFEMTQEVPPSVLDRTGAVPPASLTLLADHIIGSAVVLRLAADERMVTGHIHLEFLKPLPPEARRFHGRTDDLHLTAHGAFGRGSILAENGEVVVLISSRFAIIRRDRARSAGATSTKPSVIETKHIVAPGPTIPLDIEVSALDTVLGTCLIARDHSNARVRFQATNDLANDRGGLHGGVAALMADRAAALTVPNSSHIEFPYSHTEMRVVFLRPLPTEGTSIEVDASITHLGNSTVTTTARVRDPSGRVAVQVDSIYTR